VPFCVSCGQENPDVARFCLACGAAIVTKEAAAPRAPTDERKIITAVFVDLVGSTARSEQLDPEDVKTLIAPYHVCVRTELERHGGSFEKFIGDAILCLFGAPVAHEDDPERAVRAALAARKAVAELNAEDEWLDLHIRIGVHTDEALVMLDARRAEGEWTAAGDVLNTASRIQSAAPTDGILVGDLTYRATHEVIEYRAVEPIAAKGKVEPVIVWEVVGAQERVRPSASAERPLIGRDAELRDLVAFFEGMLEQRRPARATVIGPAGIGKSRLVLELREHLGQSCDVLSGHCLSYGEGITYWPFEAIVKQAAGIRQDDDAVSEAAKLGAALEGLATTDRDELRTMAAALSNMLGFATTPLGTYSAVEIGRAELHWGIRRFLELRAASRPTLVVLEDLHWAEPTLLELISLITDSSAGVPLAVLASARPESMDAGSPILRSGPNLRVLELDALSAETSAALVEALAAGSPHLDKAALATALRNAGGNPLFLEETVRMLAESNGAAAGEELPIPRTLQALIASRLDQLELGVKMIAQNASVIGTDFWPSAVSHLDGLNGGELEPGLAELERRDLVRAGQAATIAGEREYVFKHILIRDVAYGQVPKRRRSVLHSRFADWAEALPGGTDEHVEIVAYHLEQSCLLARAVARPAEPPPVERAVAALVRAGDKVERREGFREAERLYARALDLAGDADPALNTELSLRRARMLTGLGDLRSARTVLTAAVEDAAAIGRTDLRCAGLLALANIDWKQGRAGEGRPRLAEAALLAAELGNDWLAVLSMFEQANVRAWFDGEAEEAAADLRRALDRADALGDRTLLIEAHLRLGTALINLGEFRESEQFLQRAVDLSSELASFRDEVRATTMLGFVKYYRGEIEAAEHLAAQALGWMERISDGDLQVQNLRSLARYALARGQLELAEQRLRDALPIALELGGWMVIDIYRFLVEVLVRQERVGDAADLIAFAARNLPEEDPYAHAALLIGQATVATAQGDAAVAGSSFAEALGLLEEQQLEMDLGEARIECARSLRVFGDIAGSRAQLELARAAFARMEARTLVESIDAELEELTEGAGQAGPLRGSA
jgi:class 3 adenylate cyclase/tetratricopeptide (TPR) repeat protein